jgi:hypothetical protein
LQIAGALALALGVAGCPDDTGGNQCQPGDQFCIQDAPQLGRDPGDETLEITDSALSPGDPAYKSVRLLNRGTGTLKLEDVRLEYEVPAGATDDFGAAFELLPLPVELPFAILPIDGLELPKGVNVQVRYTKQTDGLPRTATLVLESNDIVSKIQKVVVTTDVGVPRLIVTPSPVDFGLVPKSSVPLAKSVTLLNTGSRVLNVSGFRITGDGRFGVRGDGFDISGPDGVLGVDLANAIAVPAGESRTVEATFLSDSPTPAEGNLLVFSDDPTSGSSGLAVPLIGNKSGPCILVTPRKVDFGGKLVGNVATIQVKLESCGTEALKVTSVAFGPGSSPDFGLDFSDLGGGSAAGPSAATPIVVPINDFVTIDVTFTPDAVNPRDADNVPIPDQGTLLVGSNAFEAEVKVPVSGAGSDVECPTPVIHIEEGEEVIPQTVLHLDASESYAPFGAVKDFLWQRPRPENGTAPAGTTSVLVPASTDPQPVFAVDIVGTYVFRLDVVDQSGNASGSPQCPTAEYTVIVQPDQAIHVELTWHTPGDPDESDSGEGNGTDLDLHFAHQNANGPDLDGDGSPDPWFDDKWDVFWWNTNPRQWGSFDPAAQDDPSLDRDDTDGAGPENLNLSVPEDGVTYTIGVHYWKDYSFGTSDATVKVFHYADLVYEVTYPAMKWLDMWCVGQIHWPAPVVERCAAEADPEYVTPNYVNNFFRPPGS